MLSGNALSIKSAPYTSLDFFVLATDNMFVYPRAYTRVDMAALTFVQPADAIYKYANSFYLPAGCNDTLRIFSQCADRRFPETLDDELPDMYQKLGNQLGVFQSSAHSLDIDHDNFKSHRFFYVQSYEAEPLASGTGLSTQGASLVYHVKGLAGDLSQSLPTTCVILLQYQQLIQIGADSVDVAN